MANPVPVSYSSPVQKVGGGREIFPNASLDLIAAAPENSWIKLNANNYSSVYPPADLRSTQNPYAIINAWCSFAWDTKRSGLWVWGGGHANYDCNEVYFWSARTRLWSLAYHTALYGSSHTADNPHSPVSSHTYANNIYLPESDRMLTFGGAAQADGLGLAVWAEDNSGKLRGAGCYTLQLELAGQGMLGGLPGSNYKKGAYAGINLPGARAWEFHDWYLDNPTVAGGAFPAKGHANCGACVRTENGHDVVYFSYTEGTSRGVGRAEFVDNDYRNDVVTKVANTFNDAGGSIGPIDILPSHDLMFELHTDVSTLAKGQFIDLQRPLPTGWRRIASFSGPDVAEFLGALDKGYGVLADRKRGYFVAWRKGSAVWRIDAPTRGVDGYVPDTGWTVMKLTAVTTGAPIDPAKSSGSGGGITGKWRYAPDMDCYIGIPAPPDSWTADTLAPVYAYKPANWADPRAA